MLKILKKELTVTTDQFTTNLICKVINRKQLYVMYGVGYLLNDNNLPVLVRALRAHYFPNQYMVARNINLNGVALNLQELANAMLGKDEAFIEIKNEDVIMIDELFTPSNRIRLNDYDIKMLNTNGVHMIVNNKIKGENK